ncbi:unnamed protein product [Staurois parvus]|uniref:Uncharacterized protein n=1 Tax=Staurois parvus TaxID=386267 RepID=A0ABN9DZW6_9NEOB|nr:unnamed protein product [Staurois parvus]
MASTLSACARSLGAHGTAIWRTLCLCEVPICVITDWPISNHRNSSKQDVTS